MKRKTVIYIEADVEEGKEMAVVGELTGDMVDITFLLVQVSNKYPGFKMALTAAAKFIEKDKQSTNLNNNKN